MRITKYDTELQDDYRNVLVKEFSKNYPTEDKLNNPEMISHMMCEIFRADRKAEEHVWVIAFTKKFSLISIFDVPHGTASTSLISTREIFVRLCLCGAVQFVLVHNHPSGDTTPSVEDIKVTERMKEAGQLMDIPCMDHIIIGKNGAYYSFTEHNIL
mgnify:CR=1 FL=1